MVGPQNGRMKLTSTSISDSITLAGAARRCGVAIQTVRMWILTDRLPAQKIDGVYHIDPNQLDEVYRQTVLTSPQMADRREG